MRMKGKIGIYIIIFIVFIICFFGAYPVISQFVSKLFNAEDSTKIKSKEEMFQFVHENHDKLDRGVQDMNDLYMEGDEEVIIFYEKDIITTETAGSIDELFSKYSIKKISVNDCAGRTYVKISFDSAPKDCDYWGIYFTQDALPIGWQMGEMEEDNGIYKQEGSYFQYETEQIIDNWYYYQCDTR